MWKIPFVGYNKATRYGYPDFQSENELSVCCGDIAHQSDDLLRSRPTTQLRAVEDEHNDNTLKPEAVLFIFFSEHSRIYELAVSNFATRLASTKI